MPSFFVDIDFRMPSVETLQELFRAESPDAYFPSVGFRRDELQHLVDGFANNPKIVPGTGKFETTSMEETPDGDRTRVVIRIANVKNAQIMGAALVETLTSWMTYIMDELESDPVGEHRRGALQALARYGVGADELEECKNKALFSLTDLVHWYQNNARPKEERVPEPKKLGFWASVAETLRSFLED